MKFTKAIPLLGAFITEEMVSSGTILQHPSSSFTCSRRCGLPATGGDCYCDFDVSLESSGCRLALGYSGLSL